MRKLNWCNCEHIRFAQRKLREANVLAMTRMLLRTITIGRLLIILSFVLCGSQLYSYAQEPADLKSHFYAGNEMYKEGKYEQAVNEYEFLLREGYENGNLYYNLGNSYFKHGSLGLAVLNYEKALVLIPGDSDLRANYDYLKSRLNLTFQGFSNNRFIKEADKISEAFTFDTLALFLTFLCWLFFLLMVIAIIFVNLRRFLNPALIFLSVVFLLTSVCLVRKMDNFNKAGIVVTNGAEVKFEPAKNSTTYFKVNEGAKLQVLELSDGWYKIRRQDGLIGWVEQSAIKRIAL